MKEFVYGSEENYQLLRDALEDHLCHVYHCSFPPSFSRSSGRIGFERESDIAYALFIDKGITCSNPNTSQLLRDWLATGTIRFIDFSDIKSFLKSLSILY